MELKTKLHYILLGLYQKIFVRKVSYRFHRFLFSFIILGLGYNNYQNSKVSGEKYAISSVCRMLMKFRQKELCIFDVGAFQGEYTALLLDELPRINKQFSIFCFEPNKNTFNKLIKRQFPKSVFFENIALSNKSGKTQMFDYSLKEGSEHASLYPESISTLHKSKAVKFFVELESLDNYMKKKSIRRINFLKIDTEGNEYAVLTGAKSTIKKGKIDIIQFEFNQMNIYSRVFKKDIMELLSDYTLFRMLPDGLIEINAYDPLLDEVFVFHNILAVKKDLAHLI